MKKLKYIFAILLCLSLCGCVKSNTSMVINEDKSMTITLDLMLNEYSRKNYGDLLTKKSEELKKSGYSIKTISEEFYSGLSITKKYNSIDDTIYEGKNNVDISKFTDDNFNNKIFTVKKGLFYNTYYANFEFESLLKKYDRVIESIEKKADDDDENTEEKIDFKGSEYTFSVSFPDRPLTSNATKVSKDGKTLNWTLSQTENSNVKFSFKMINKTVVIIVAGVVFVIFIIVTYIIIRNIKRKHSISSDIKRDKPILKEYDPSIENQINNTMKEEQMYIGVSAQPIVEQNNVNVGVSAQPIVEPEKEEIIEIKEEPVIVEPQIVDEPKPEVSVVNQDMKKLNNYEINLPEESMARKAMEYTKANPVKKEPLFINDNSIPVEPVDNNPVKQEIVIDKPDAVDINSIL